MTSLLNLDDAPEDALERLVWLSGLDQALRKEVNNAWQETYYQVRLEGRFQAALDLHLHPRKRALAWTRHENQARGRSVTRWRDGY